MGSLFPEWSLSVRLLVFSDLHRDHDTARELVRRSVDVDAVLAAGDLATFRQGLRDVVSILSAIERPTLLVAGNSETPDELREACAHWESAHVLHGEELVLGGHPFFGLGGACPVTPFGAWSFDLTEDEARTALAPCPEHAVLVTHAPPYGHVDQDSGAKHLGSRALLETIETRNPRLVVCGHIHGSWTQESRLANTRIVNAGPEGQIIEID